MDPLIVVFGLGVGILVGMTGVGGGSLMTPLLLLVGGYSPVVAIGTDLAYGAITKTVGGWRHLDAGHVDLRLSWWLAAGSMPGSVLGVIAVNRLHDEYGDAFDGMRIYELKADFANPALSTISRSTVTASLGLEMATGSFGSRCDRNSRPTMMIASTPANNHGARSSRAPWA
mgnify:CR=1 FL=1